MKNILLSLVSIAVLSTIIYPHLVRSSLSFRKASAQTGGTTYYISPTSPPGNDQNDGLSETTPLATFNKAWELLYPGDTLILLDGTYRQTLRPNKRNGEPGNPITIRAKNDGQAVIDGERVRRPVQIGDTWPGPIYKHFVLEGIVAKNGDATELDDPTGAVIKIVGSYNILRRVSAYNAYTDGNSTVIGFGQNSNYNLMEDCVAAGSGRKMINMYKNQFNTVRRCFTDWREWGGRRSCQDWPNGGNMTIYNASDNIIENSIAVGPVGKWSVGLQANDANATASANRILGSVALNAGMNWDGTEIIWPSTRPTPTICDVNKVIDFDNWPHHRVGFEVYGQGTMRNNVLRDIFAWNNAGSGVGSSYHPIAGNYGLTILDHATVINSGLCGNCREKGLNISGAADFTITNSRIDGTSYQNGGARLQYRYINGILTNEPLWPWPMEERIKAEYADVFGIQNFSVTETVYPILAKYGAVPTAGSSDLNNDGQVDRYDAGILFNNWFNPDTPSADIYSDSKVNGIDFSYLKRDWTGN
jgi:hypothetical protein